MPSVPFFLDLLFFELGSVKLAIQVCTLAELVEDGVELDTTRVGGGRKAGAGSGSAASSTAFVVACCSGSLG